MLYRLGSACSHVAALLFKLQACTQLGINKVACTSKLCSWNKSRRKAHPAPLIELNFKRPKKNELQPLMQTPEKRMLSGFTSPDPAKNCKDYQKKKIAELKEIAPKAALLTSISWWLEENILNSETDSADEVESNNLPEPLTSLYDPSLINETEQIIKEKSKKKYNEYLNTTYQKQYENLQKISVTQSENEIWKLHRAGRITASVSKNAFSTNIDKPSMSFLKLVMQYNENVSVAAMKYGTNMEPIARKFYYEKYKKYHTSFQTLETGLHINSDFPCLGASPDGLVYCQCHGYGLLEIKCPYKYKNGLEKWYSDKNSPIDRALQIKETHQYYYQMQHQMLVTKRNYCDFFVYCSGKKENDTFILRITKNNDFCEKLKEKLILIFNEVILPEIVCRKNDPENDLQQKLYCKCCRPSFPPMIACEKKDCPIEWYHYSCVNVKRAPVKSWICPDCKNVKKQ